MRQVLGVDVAQKELVVTLGRLSDDLTTELYSRRNFANKESGFDALLKWLKKNTATDVELRVVMEATGVYHQKFAYFLDKNGIDLSVVLPNKISNYMRTLAAIRHDELYKDLFTRLVSRHGIKMKAAVAVQRKLLELTYILFKNETIYDPNRIPEKRKSSNCNS